MDYTVDGMLTRVKTWAAIPTGQPALSDTNLLMILNDELQGTVIPYIMSLREEFFTSHKDYVLTTGQDEYLVPSQAVGGIVREVKRITQSDFSGSRIHEYDIPQYDLNRVNFNVTIGFTMRGNYIHMWCYDTNVGDTLRVYYDRRPNQLVKAADCAQATVVAGNTITCSSVPSSWSNVTVDIISSIPPFDVTTESVTATVSGYQLIFTVAPTINAGDYICISGTSPVAQIPWESTQMLCQLAVIRILEILNDPSGLQVAKDRYKLLEERMLRILSPRVPGELKKIVNWYSFA